MFTCIVAPLYEGFSEYFPPTHVLYIVAFVPLMIQVAILLTLLYPDSACPAGCGGKKGAMRRVPTPFPYHCYPLQHSSLHAKIEK
jgi:hypothetical protein